MANENINPIAENSSGGDRNNRKFVSILTDNSTGTAQDYYIKDLDAQVQLTTKLEKPENIEVTELGELRSNNKLIPGRTYNVTYGSNNNKVVLKALAGNVLDESGKLIVSNKEYDVKYHIELINKDEAGADGTKFNGYLTGSETGNYGGFIYWLRDPETGNEAPWDWVTTISESQESPFDDGSNNIIIKPYIVDNKYTKPTTAILSQVIPSKIEGCNKIIDLNNIIYKSNGRIDVGDNSTTTHIGFHVNKSGIENKGGRVSIYLPNGDNNGEPLFNFGYNEDEEKYFNVHNLDKINFSSSNFTIDSNINFSGTGKTFSCSVPTTLNSTFNVTGATTLNSLTVSGNTTLNNKLIVNNESIEVGKNGGETPKVVVFKNVESKGYGLCIGQGTDNTLSICQYKTTSDNLKNNLNNNYYLKINNNNIILNRDFRIETDGSNVFTVNQSGDTNIFGNFEIKNKDKGEFVKVETSGQITLNIPGTLTTGNDGTSMKQKRFTVYAGSAIFNAGYMNNLPQIWTSEKCENINLRSKNIIIGQTQTLELPATVNTTIYGEKLTINSNTVLNNNLTLTRPLQNTPIRIKLDDGIECQGDPGKSSEDYSHLYGGFAAVIPRGKKDGKVNQRWRFYGRADDENGTPKNFFNIGFEDGKLGVWAGYNLDFFRIAFGTTTIKDLTVNNISKLGGTLDVSGATTLNNSLSVSGVTILNNSLIVGNATTLKNSLDVISATKLRNTLDVEGATTLKNSLNVTGNTVLKSSLNVTSATTLGSTLKVANDLYVGPDNDSNGKMIYTGGLQTNGIAKVGGNLQVDGNTVTITNGTLLTNNIAATTTEKNVSILGNLSITGTTSSTGGFFDTSDGRLKTNLSPIKVNLDSLSKLQKVHFDWKDKEKMGSSRQLGMIAQEVQELYPELISTSEDGTLSLAYDKLGVIALEAIDLLHKENKELKSELQDMRDRLDRLESLICGGK